ncbi:exported hypothetical protein [Gammaproteobacteria bacterium]
MKIQDFSSVFLVLSMFSTLAMADSALLGMLTNRLGVNEQQASGGISALMEIAKKQLSGTDYAHLLSSAPDLGALAKTNPAATTPKSKDPSTSWMSAASSMLGVSSLNQLAQLTQTFSQYGLSADMIGKFVKTALDYVQTTGGADLTKILAGAFKF